MQVDPLDPSSHGKPLWIVHGHTCCPALLCAKLRAYSEDEALLPAGTSGPTVCIWGYSVYNGEPGFRTLGINVKAWLSRQPPETATVWFDRQQEALDVLRDMTTPVMPKTFMDRAVAGDVLGGVFYEDGRGAQSLLDFFHDEIDRWHDASTDIGLIEWLGLSRSEYARAVGRDGALDEVVAARRSRATR